MPGKNSKKVDKDSQSKDDFQVKDDYESDHDEPETSDWAENTERRKSVCDFDREDVARFETSKVEELTNEDLLKVVIRRGEMQKNPVLSGGCKRVLKQINLERLPRKETSFRGGSSSFRGNSFRGDSSFRGNSFRGGNRFNRDRESYSSRQQPHYRNDDDQDRFRERERGGGDHEERHFDRSRKKYVPKSN